VLHCFTGGLKAFQFAMAGGCYVSFWGSASINSFEAADLLAEVPGVRLHVETDSPYLARVPRRGGRNEPSYVVHVVVAVARLLGSDPAVVARATTANARRFYGLT
jgi:TatD DNase family protein